MVSQQQQWDQVRIDDLPPQTPCFQSLIPDASYRFCELPYLFRKFQFLGLKSRALIGTEIGYPVKCYTYLKRLKGT